MTYEEKEQISYFDLSVIIEHLNKLNENTQKELLESILYFRDAWFNKELYKIFEINESLAYNLLYFSCIKGLGDDKNSLLFKKIKTINKYKFNGILVEVGEYSTEDNFSFVKEVITSKVFNPVVEHSIQEITETLCSFARNYSTEYKKLFFNTLLSKKIIKDYIRLNIDNDKLLYIEDNDTIIFLKTHSLYKKIKGF
jgi:hypothetical protein